MGYGSYEYPGPGFDGTIQNGRGLERGANARGGEWSKVPIPRFPLTGEGGGFLYIYIYEYILLDWCWKIQIQNFRKSMHISN